jgi:aspartate aminotransferase
MIIELSERIQRVKPSPTLTISANAAKLKREGVDVISLSTGEPDFDTPDFIQKAAIKAIKEGQTRYTAVDGTPELKEAVINKFRRDNNLQYDADQILVSVGGKQSFFNLCQALLNKGDEVIIPAPYWVSYPDMVLLADASPVIVEASQEQNFKLTPEQLDNAITAKTHLLVLNSPSNPTGVCYSAEELKALGEVLMQHPHVMIATDDMYEHILFGNQSFTNIVMECPELYDRTIVLNGVSKAYAMTGWRIGYAGGPKQLIQAMKKMQSQSTSNPCSVSQAAAAAALNGDQSCITKMVEQYEKRHNYVYKTLDAIPGLSCLPSDGTFYSFPNAEEAIERLGGIDNDVVLAEYILHEANVAVVPGSAFGLAGHFRVSYATSMENLEESLSRIAKLLST